jgi:hypothetical protein
MKTVLCSSCKRGDVEHPADGLFYGQTHYGKPYRAYLCLYHRYIIIEDGGSSKMIRPVSVEGWKEYSEILFDLYKEKRSIGDIVGALRVHGDFVKAQDKAGLNV